MTTATLPHYAQFPEILGELPPGNDQADLSRSFYSAIPRVSRFWVEDDLPRLASQTEQNLWQNLGTWDL